MNVEGFGFKNFMYRSFFFMKYLWVSFLFSAEWYLGWKKSELIEVSWYQLLHWDSLREAQSKHRLSKWKA